MVTSRSVATIGTLVSMVTMIMFISVINQLDAQHFLFYSKSISCLYMFRALCAHHQEVKIVLHNLWYHHTYRWPSRTQVAKQQLIVKQKFCASSWLINEINIFACFASAISNFKYFIIIIIVYTNYIFVHLLDNKVF